MKDMKTGPAHPLARPPPRAAAIYRRLACYMKEHFGDDARGKQKAMYFLPWSFDFLTRYRCAGARGRAW